MTRDNIIKSLVKSIDVLKVIQSNDGVSVSKLHKLTSIPKPTLCRILSTLEQCHVIRKSLVDQLYRSNYILGCPGELKNRSLLVSVAAEVLDELCRRIVWPSDFLIRNGIYMEMAENSRRTSPLSVNRDNLGDRINMIYSAVGRAYLAYCPEPERDSIIESLRKSVDPFYSKARDSSWLEKIINETLAQGYGVRELNFSSFKKDAPGNSDGLSAIAVPVFLQENIVGCISILWPSRLYTVDKFAEMHLEDLLSASRDISRRTMSLSGS